jgi:hypothetical protein
MRQRTTELLLIAVLTVGTLYARNDSQHDEHQHHSTVDSRGDLAMGFDHTRTRHHFVVTKSGGIIEVTATDASDTTTVTKVRAHLQEIAAAFTAGDFSKPTFIHAQDPPGADVLKQLGPKVVYRYTEVPQGARISISTRIAKGVQAVHDFFKMQIADHKTGDTIQ